MTGIEWFVAIMTFVAMTITMTLWLQEGETFKNLHALKYSKQFFRILQTDERQRQVATFTDGAFLLLELKGVGKTEVQKITFMLEENPGMELHMKARIDPVTFEVYKIYGYFFRPKQGGIEYADDRETPRIRD